MSAFTSFAASGRRYAAPPSREMIFSAHGRASLGDVGRHVKIWRRLGVSDTPVGLYGPVTTRSDRCGILVMPCSDPICVSAMLWPIGARLSLTGPSNVLMNAAAMRCGPARTVIGGVLMLSPFGSDCDDQRSIS